MNLYNFLSDVESAGPEIVLRRIEFLKLCFRYLLSSSSAMSLLEHAFRLGNLWKFDKESLLLNYLSVILERGSSDHLVEETLRQVRIFRKTFDGVSFS